MGLDTRVTVSGRIEKANQTETGEAKTLQTILERVYVCGLHLVHKKKRKEKVRYDCFRLSIFGIVSIWFCTSSFGIER